MKITIKLTEAQVKALEQALFCLNASYAELDSEELTEVAEDLAEAEKIQAMLEQKVWEEQEVARLVSENPGISKTHIRKVVQNHIKANA